MKVEGLKDAEAWRASTMLEIGWHVVTIQEAEEGESSNHYPQFEFLFGNDDGDIRDWLVYTQATIGKVKQLVEATGVVPEDDDLKASDLLGKTLGIKVGMEPSTKGGDRKVVQAYVTPDEAKRRAKSANTPDTRNGPPPDDEGLPF